jgi:cytochrome c-type biogenesis protein CcmH
MKALAIALACALVALGPAVAGLTDAETEAVARQLRCVVCQNLSVADSPSEMARQMRDLIRERLEGGESPEAVKAYFVERYGEWVLLSPPTQGFALLAWTIPFGVLAGGLFLAVLLLRRWSRGTGLSEADEEVEDADLAAVREAVARKQP